MKTIIQAVILTGILGLLLFSVVSVNAQGGPPPPPPAMGHGLTTNQLPEGGTATIENEKAPVECGLILLLIMGVAYAYKKITDERSIAN